MKSSGPKDVAAGIFGVIALVCGIVQFFYLPFLFAPLALVALIVAIMCSPKYRGLYELTAVVITVGFIVGAAIAVKTGHALY
jgi:hypothetical protein